MKKIVFLIALFLTPVYAIIAGMITVDYTAGPGLRDVTDASLTALPNGNVVSIGYFDSGFDVSTNANNLVALGGAFNAFDSTNIQTIFGQAGRFADSASVDDAVFMDGFNEKIYMWAFKTAGAAVPAGDFSNVSEYGLFSGTAANWFFPDTVVDPIFTSTMITSSEVDQAFFGSFDGDHLILQQAAEVVVPEPSAYILFVLGILALGVRRRR